MPYDTTIPNTCGRHARDSRTSILAFPGETAVLSGGVQLAPSWEPCASSHRKKIKKRQKRGQKEKKHSPAHPRPQQRENTPENEDIHTSCWRANVKDQLPHKEVRMRPSATSV
jgi:hypothetical protein